MITVLNLNYSYLLCSASLAQIASRQEIFEGDINILVSCLLCVVGQCAGYYHTRTTQRNNEETIPIPVWSAMRIKQFNWINISEWVATFAMLSPSAVSGLQIRPGVCLCPLLLSPRPTRELLAISHIWHGEIIFQMLGVEGGLFG